MRPLIPCFILLSCASLLYSPVLGGTPTAAPRLQFNRDIRPFLSDTCFKCHGFDAKARKAHLRLDVRDEALKPRDGGPPIVPGHPEQSQAYLRLTSSDADERMPPIQSHLTLTPQQVAAFKRWIEEGAEYQSHWAFIPPKDEPPPAVEGPAGWAKNPIDAFVLNRLRAEGLSPSPEADRRTLIRRVTLDLTGLPPAPPEVEAFVNDASPDAYEKVVERLLACPRYGERMVLDWLDAARYADSNGYQADPTRTMWPWRDWAVSAMNANMPFDRFAVEQVAGDLLPGATPSQRLASGFNRNHPYNGEGGRIAEETRVENVLDRVDTTATAFLGLTVGCAKCHDHKYDPITQKEYYQLFAYFNQSSESGQIPGGTGNAPPVMTLSSPEDETKLAGLKKAQKEADARLAAALAKIDAEQASWEKTAGVAAKSAGTTRPAGAEGTTRPAAPALPADVSAALAVLPDKRSEEQTKAIREFYRTRIAGGIYKPLADAAAAAKKAAEEFDKSLTRVMVMDDAKPRESHVLLRGQYDKPGDKVEPGVPACLHPLRPGVDEPLREKLGFSAYPPRRVLSAATHRIFAPGVEPATSRSGASLRSAPGVVGDGSVAGSASVAGIVQIAGTGAPAANNRLALARWIVDPANPLTARVIVNRYWQTFFGAGLVKTPDDFGSQGEPPSHPELLDFLARRFVAGGWDVKGMHRLIVTSATYRQSSKVTPALLGRDLANRLLARGARFRLSSFALRDQALAASGLLVEKVGGPPVRPYQPPGVWEEMSLGKIAYVQDHGENLYRRSLYTFWRRTVAPAMMFDVSPRTVCMVRPLRTNTPLQALALLNDPTYVEAARVLSEGLLKESGTTPAQKLDAVFVRFMARPADEAERGILLPALDRLRAQFSADPAAAAKLVGVGEKPRDPKIDAGELAAWTALVNTVMNMDEAMTKE